MNYAQACELYEKCRRVSAFSIYLVEVSERNFECHRAYHVSALWRRVLRAGSRYNEITCGRVLGTGYQLAMMPIRPQAREMFIAELKARREVLGQ